MQRELLRPRVHTLAVIVADPRQTVFIEQKDHHFLLRQRSQEISTMPQLQEKPLLDGQFYDGG